MNNNEPWFVRERALAYSGLLLTKREDLKIRSSVDSEHEVDILVEIIKNGKRTLRFFGVQLLGGTSLLSQNGEPTLTSTKLLDNSSEVSLPLCIFMIDVKQNVGRYTWAVEPTVQDDEANLIRHETLHWSELDRDAIDIITHRVDQWYDKIRPTVSA